MSEVKDYQGKSYRESLVRDVKLLGQEIIDRAEDLVGTGDLISDFEIKLLISGDSLPSIERTTTYLCKRYVQFRQIEEDKDEHVRLGKKRD